MISHARGHWNLSYFVSGCITLVKMVIQDIHMIPVNFGERHCLMKSIHFHHIAYLHSGTLPLSYCMLIMKEEGYFFSLWFWCLLPGQKTDALALCHPLSVIKWGCTLLYSGSLVIENMTLSTANISRTANRNSVNFYQNSSVSPSTYQKIFSLHHSFNSTNSILHEQWFHNYSWVLTVLAQS